MWLVFVVRKSWCWMTSHSIVSYRPKPIRRGTVHSAKVENAAPVSASSPTGTYCLWSTSIPMTKCQSTHVFSPQWIRQICTTTQITAYELMYWKYWRLIRTDKSFGLTPHIEHICWTIERTKMHRPLYSCNVIGISDRGKYTCSVFVFNHMINLSYTQF